jgi:hypothetical protein
MHILMTQRKLKPGSYDDWREAWESEQQPKELVRGYIIRSVDDPNEVIAFGIFDDARSMLADPTMQEAQKARFERMAPFVVETGVDGLYELVEEFGP